MTQVTNDFGIEMRSGIDVDHLLFNQPEEYTRLLSAYNALLGVGGAWCSRCKRAANVGWGNCLQAAIRAVACRSNIKPESLVLWLGDAECFPKTRQILIETAQRLLRQNEVA